MTKPQRLRMSIDITMTTLSIILMGGNFLFPADLVHEILGVGLFVLWGVHIFLNHRWYSAIFRGKYKPSPLKNLILFFSKDKNQIEKIPLSDFFSRLQSTLGDISFYFFLFSFIRVVIRFKFVTNITQAPCIFVS